MLLLTPSSIWFIIIGSASLTLLLITFFLLFIQYKERKLHHLKEINSLHKSFDETILQVKLEIQEEIFTHISQEIHDNIGQVLSLAKLNLNTLDIQIQNEKIQMIDELVGKAILDLRNLSHNLNSEYIKEIGLAEAVRQLLVNLEKSGKFMTSFIATSNLIDIHEITSIVLYRIIQEALNNIIKHAKATEVHVTIIGNTSLEKIIVRDNGVGFDAGIISGKKTGIGFKNIIDRAKIINHLVKVESIINQGTTIEIINNSFYGSE